MEEYNYHYKYPHPAVTADCVVLGFDGNGLNVLLIERGGDTYHGYWAIPGGFLEKDEDGEVGALRELLEETGLKLPHAIQFGAFTKPHRDPREWVISIGYYALTRIADVKGLDDAAKAKWFPVNELPKLLAFDHEDILKKAFHRIKEDGRTEMLPEMFFDDLTMDEYMKLSLALTEVESGEWKVES